MSDNQIPVQQVRKREAKTNTQAVKLERRGRQGKRFKNKWRVMNGAASLTAAKTRVSVAIVCGLVPTRMAKLLSDVGRPSPA